MSCLGGRARGWAYGRRLTDPTCFSTYEVFKEELRQAFEPPQNEFRSRAEFLDLQQGKHDVHAYAQRARYLVSNIVTNPIDEATKVATFMKGLRDGPVKTYLFREYPTRLDFEEVELPRSLLEVRLATSVVVWIEKRAVRARFSYEEKKLVDELIVLDLDDKSDMVLGMPWLVRHNPVIDWAKRTIVRFRSSGATESDDPVGAAHAPRGACDPPAEAARTLTTKRAVREKCEPNQTPQIQSDLRGSRSVKIDAVVSTVVDKQVEQEEPVPEGSDLGASAPGVDAIGPNINGRSAVRRRGKRGASAPGADAASSADGCKRPAPEMLACSRAAGLYDKAIHNQTGLDCVLPRKDPADEQKGDLAMAGPGQDKTRGTGFLTRRERRKRAKLRKSRSGTETQQAVSAGQTQRRETTFETLGVLTRTDTGLQYRKMALESPQTLASELTSLPAMSWKRETEALKQLVTEGSDALSANSKKERFDEQSWDSLKSSPLFEVLREYKDVLPNDIPVDLPQNKGVQHEIDLVPGTKYYVTRQWPLSREQVKAIDDFFESRRKAGQVRESKSPHSAPTFCVKKAQGGWRIVHAYNKLNDATVPAQTPIPRKM
ncbi:unnamed protein product [Phytophthora fragariaefolia]|uniref:Unnamed protein product n=1 Tax=Phytophthora fragariaefolia TaxID=1490495 RepID=A0A9W6X5C6_9STRA|nr:unnamed protein product [Phytophthora fragariaefolia]